MRITFALIAALTLFLTVIFLMEAKSAIHQILAAITFLSFVVSAATVAILGSIAKLHASGSAVTIHQIQTPTDSPPAPRKGSNWVNVGK